MKKTAKTAALLFPALWSATAVRAGTLLYNGALGTAPQTQGWLEFTALGGTPTTTTTSSNTTLDTTSNIDIMGGYSNYTPLGALVNSSFPAMSPTTGFTVNLGVQVNSESHSNNNRGGFDWIVLGSDENGVELDFWDGDIWAQSTSFTHAEDAAFNTTAAITQYALTISGSTYTLDANGTQILTGSTRNYSSFGVPYNLANYIFIGDDTNAADASETFNNLSVVPEPVSGTICVGLAMLMMGRRRTRLRAP